MNEVNTFLAPFYKESEGQLRITALQASRFAKEIAGDFNPIHDPESRRFCVPGDLLFAIVLERTGLYPRMSFKFSSMVGDQIPLQVRQQGPGVHTVADAAGKQILEARYEGEPTCDTATVQAFLRKYVAFSGKTFPHFFKPLFEQHGVMFHPQRPLVIYHSMDFEISTVDLKKPGLKSAGTDMEVDGRRAEMTFRFDITDDGARIGFGSKHMILSGLREYDEAVMDSVIEEFYRLKQEYEDARSTRA